MLLTLLLACAAPSPRPDVFLIVVDALRADRVGCLGARRATPAMDRLCAEALSFPHATSHGVDTRSAMPALLSGLSAEGPWLGERFEALGYSTALFSGNAWIQAPLTAGFQVQQRVEYRYMDGDRVDGEDLVEAFKGWLQGVPAETPALAWLHLMDVHPPLAPPEPWAGRFASPGDALMFNGRVRAPIPEDQRARLADRYDEATAWTDTLIDAALRAIERRGRSSVVVLTSDHGEALGEHDQLGHGGAITPEISRVPLLVRLPERQGREVEGAVAHEDLLPTLLRAAGEDEDLPGVDLRGPIPERALPISAHALDDGRPLLGELRWPWLITTEARYQLQTGEVGAGEAVTPDTSGFRTITFQEDASGRLRAMGYTR